MTELLPPTEIGRARTRVDGPLKVRGLATYAYETAVESPLFLHLVQSTIARGRITEFDASSAEAVDGVAFVLHAGNAAALADDSDGELAVLQTADVAFRGQLIGVVAADTSETARE